MDYCYLLYSIEIDPFSLGADTEASAPGRNAQRERESLTNTIKSEWVVEILFFAWLKANHSV